MKRPELLPISFKGSLYKLTEECGEVLQAIGKLQRHGILTQDPYIKDKIYDNGKDLMDELSDLKHAIGETERFYEKEERQIQSGLPTE